MISFLACLAMTAGPKLSAWLVFYDNGESLKTFEAYANMLDSVSAEWYQSGANGAVEFARDTTPEKRAAGLAIARRRHVSIFGMIQNPGFDPGSVEAFLGDPAKRAAHAQALCDACVRDGLDGIDLDYESLKAADRDNFSLFVETMGETLHAKHLLLAIALHSKESEPGNWDGAQAQDWVRIGKAADRVRVMCYDQHWSTSEAGPVADLAWVTTTMKFAVSAIPPSKLEIGVPNYGYDWIGKKGSDVDWNGFTALPGAQQAKRDPASQELVLPHGDAIAWICDGVSEAPKVDLARTLGARGVCVWRLGTEDPKFWDAISQAAKKR